MLEEVHKQLRSLDELLKQQEKAVRKRKKKAERKARDEAAKNCRILRFQDGWCGFRESLFRESDIVAITTDEISGEAVLLLKHGHKLEFEWLDGEPVAPITLFQEAFVLFAKDADLDIPDYVPQPRESQATDPLA